MHGVFYDMLCMHTHTSTDVRKYKLTYATLTMGIFSYVIMKETRNYYNEVMVPSGLFLPFSLSLLPSLSLSLSLSPLPSLLSPALDWNSLAMHPGQVLRQLLHLSLAY